MSSILALILSGAPAASAAPVLPESDPFYSYSGSTPLKSIPPGTVLKTRHVTVSLAGTATPFPGDQLLYRTNDELAGPSLAVTTVIKPLLTVVPTKNLVSYQTAYDSLTGKCDPSYTLQGGAINDPDNSTAKQESMLIAPYLAAGDYVVVSDYEGVNHHWAAGHESGYGTLDGIRAAETDLGLAATNKVALVGYSGGAIASEWASELAPSYASELNIVGVAEGGIPVDFAHNLRYITGSPEWSGIIPAILLSLSRAYGVNLGQYLSSYGAALVSQDSNGCINGFLSSHPGLTYQQLLKPQYRNIFAIKPIVDIINNLIMGSVAGHPVGPLYMENGNADGTGDDVMIAGDVRALAREYCAQGVDVDYVEDVGSKFNHGNTGAKFEATSAPLQVARWFTGLPAANNCATIRPGNSLAPLALQRQSSTPSAAPNHHASGPATASAVPSTSGAGVASAPIASTGARDPAELVLVALLMLGLGTGLVRFARTRAPRRPSPGHR